MGASRRTIPCPAIREKGSAAYRASLCVRGGAVACQRRLQHRIIGQNSLPEVAAVRTRPALVHHIARPSQRQAAIFPVIVGAKPCDQLTDCRLFLPCQLTLCHSVTFCHRAFSAIPGNRSCTQCLSSRGNHDSGCLWEPVPAPRGHGNARAAS